jgi:hypothetical protein
MLCRLAGRSGKTPWGLSQLLITVTNVFTAEYRIGIRQSTRSTQQSVPYGSPNTIYSVFGSIKIIERASRPFDSYKKFSGARSRSTVFHLSFSVHSLHRFCALRLAIGSGIPPSQSCLLRIQVLFFSRVPFQPASYPNYTLIVVVLMSSLPSSQSSSTSSGSPSQLLSLPHDEIVMTDREYSITNLIVKAASLCNRVIVERCSMCTVYCDEQIQQELLSAQTPSVWMAPMFYDDDIEAARGRLFDEESVVDSINDRC